MGVPVPNFDDFRAKLHEYQDRSVIFGFLLYDSRESQEPVARFAEELAEWIDDLARSSGIYFFFPVRSDGADFRNPSIEVARLFRIGIGRLPGVVLFAPPRSDGRIHTEHAVYFPLDEKDFSNVGVCEPILTDLFDLVRDTLEKTHTPHEVLVSIQADVKRLRRKTTSRGFAAHLRRGAQIMLYELPRELLSSFAEGVGKAVGELG